MSGLKLLGPNGSDAVTLQNTQNVTKTVDVTDVASDVFVKGRVGTGGGLNFRNKIVDGRFDFWYEGTSQTASGYGSATMWSNVNSGTTKVTSKQPLVAGVDLPAIEVPSAQYFYRTVVTSVVGSANRCVMFNNIENVGTLAGKTATLSFYAKADAVKNVVVEFIQVFGTGGSTSVNGITSTIGLSTVWKRYSVQVNIPSISGKTVGTGGYLGLNFWFDAETSVYGGRSANLGQQSGTFDLACIQLEEGSVMTPFEELPFEISQQRVGRYYETSYPYGSVVGSIVGSNLRHRSSVASTTLITGAQFSIQKRTTPTVVAYNPVTGLSGYVRNETGSNPTANTGYISPCGFGILGLGTAPVAGDAITYHYVADARL